MMLAPEAISKMGRNINAATITAVQRIAIWGVFRLGEILPMDGGSI